MYQDQARQGGKSPPSFILKIKILIRKITKVTTNCSEPVSPIRVLSAIHIFLQGQQ